MAVERERKEKLRVQKRFGEHVRKFRESKKMTQEELADLAFLERSNIARLEAGRTNTTIFIITKLAVAFNIEVDEFLKGFK